MRLPTWVYNHGADRFERMGNAVAAPFMAISEWCRRRWWETR